MLLVGSSWLWSIAVVSKLFPWRPTNMPAIWIVLPVLFAPIPTNNVESCVLFPKCNDGVFLSRISIVSQQNWRFSYFYFIWYLILLFVYPFWVWRRRPTQSSRRPTFLAASHSLVSVDLKHCNDIWNNLTYEQTKKHEKWGVFLNELVKSTVFIELEH